MHPSAAWIRASPSSPSSHVASLVPSHAEPYLYYGQRYYPVMQPALDGHALSLLQPVVVSLRAAGTEAGTEAGTAAVAGERGGQGERTQQQTPKPQPSPKPRASEQVGGSGRVRRSG